LEEVKLKKTKLLIAILCVVVVTFVVTEIAFAEDVEQDPFEMFDLRFVLLGVGTGLIYALLGWTASGEEFEPKKFLRTIVIVALITLGLDLTNLTFDIYSAMLEPAMITIFLEKLLNTATRRLEEAKPTTS